MKKICLCKRLRSSRWRQAISHAPLGVSHSEGHADAWQHEKIRTLDPDLSRVRPGHVSHGKMFYKRFVKCRGNSRRDVETSASDKS